MKRGVKTPQKANGAIRIISGRWRGRKLPVMDVEGLRPTTDRNKETLFNWLMPYVRDARCLDAFAGSGGLGFEALSRYAKSAMFIELSKQAVNNLKDNLRLLKTASDEATVVQGSAAQSLAKIDTQFDLIFLDPPFNKNLLPDVIEQIASRGLLATEGVIYIESEGQAEYSVPKGWSLLKEKQTSQVLVRLYQRAE